MGFMGCNFPAPELVFPPHFLKIVIEGKALELPSLRTVVGGKQGHAVCGWG